MQKENTGLSYDDLKLITEEIIELLLIKNHDYGDAWRKHGIAGVLVRLSDKSLRLQSLGEKEALVVDEKWEDTLLDIAGYAILGLSLRKKVVDNE